MERVTVSEEGLHGLTFEEGPEGLINSYLAIQGAKGKPPFYAKRGKPLSNKPQATITKPLLSKEKQKAKSFCPIKGTKCSTNIEKRSKGEAGSNINESHFLLTASILLEDAVLCQAWERIAGSQYQAGQGVGSVPQWLAQHLRPEGHQRTAPPSIYIAEERDMQRPISPPRNNPWSNPIWRMRKIAEIQRGRKERGRKERRRKY
ncbi:hypothetical protein CYMTET_25100 [Cymbomonas tetramitiformis]|uniref:Uncharacterized protein n=1 Tax=Cymbomonas tetramitiformis TaxID=36881 RepID=A0AAE0FUV0_9CHLO|nr:hypothetical protein CYMTET_25100 [Cymbomonas tetramitiformis]